MQKLNPLNDFIFQKLFGEKGSEEELLSLLNAILYPDGKDKLVSIEVLENKTFAGDMIGDKMGILDVRGITDKGSHINVEVQRKDYGNMDTRSPFYWSLQFSKAIKKGDEYADIPKVITINILDFNFFPLPLFHTTFHLREDSHRDYILTDVMELHYIEMPKFRKLRDKDLNIPLHRWLAFFNNNLSDDDLKELISMDTAIKKAAEKIDYLASDEETVRLYQAREMALFDYRSGIAQREKEIAKSMLKDNLSLDLISKHTGLTVVTIQRLQAELNQR